MPALVIPHISRYVAKKDEQVPVTLFRHYIQTYCPVFWSDKCFMESRLALLNKSSFSKRLMSYTLPDYIWMAEHFQRRYLSDHRLRDTLFGISDHNLFQRKLEIKIRDFLEFV